MPKPPKRARLRPGSRPRSRAGGGWTQAADPAPCRPARCRTASGRDACARPGSARPVGRQVHGLRHERLLGRVRRALVQLHGDVGAQLLLDGHVALGRPTHLRAVVDGAEREALVVQLERVGQAEHLEPARVSEHGAVVVHEAVHAAGSATTSAPGRTTGGTCWPAPPGCPGRATGPR